eukprot:scaffold5178_cov364-Prasinococcus_capsulatus_cf.AAC.15
MCGLCCAAHPTAREGARVRWRHIWATANEHQEARPAQYNMQRASNEATPREQAADPQQRESTSASRRLLQ